MSAVLKDEPRFDRMSAGDLEEVTRIENAVYTHPWTRGNFADSLQAGYRCKTLRIEGELAAYFVLMVAAGEAHLLNLSVSAERQRQGIGSLMLREVMRLGRHEDVRRVFLEVRPSNLAALALYDGFGFKRIAERRGYYPAHGGREDALVLTFAL